MADATLAGVGGGSNADQNQKKPRRWGRIIAVATAVVLVVLVVVGVLLPRIAGGMAPGIVREQAGKFVKGTVTVDRAALSWGGPQRVGPITWTDEAGAVVAKAEVETSAGLLGLATGNLDLGTVKVTGAEARLVRAQDGTLNVQSLMKPQPRAQRGGGVGGGAKKPASLPAGLQVRLEVDDARVTFIDEAAPGGTQTVVLKDADVLAAIDSNKPLEVKVSAKAEQAGGGAGAIALDVRATNWAASDGTITPDKATLTAKGSVDALPVAMLDAVVPAVKDSQGSVVPLSRALGPTLAATIDANGSFKDATARLHVQTANAQADGDVRIAEGVLTTTSPLTVKAAGVAVGNLVPALGAATREGAATRLDRLPDATLTIDALRVTLPRDGKPLDLRGAGARVQVLLTEVVGQTRLAANEPLQVMRIAPLTATVETADLATGVRVTASTTATLAERPAGDIAVDLTASGLLDEKGAMAKTTPLVSGSAQVRRITTAIAQPFVEALGVDLPRDVGPTLDVDVKAAARADATDIDLTAQAQHLTASGGFTLSPTQIATKTNDFALTMKRGGGLIGMFVKPETGFKVEPPASGDGVVTLTLRGVSVPRETRKDGATVLRLEQMTGKMIASAAGLRVTRAGSGAGPLDLSNVSVRAAVSPGKESTVDISGVGAHGGEAFTLAGNIAVTDLWVKRPDGTASINTDIKALRPAGRLQVTDLPASVAALAQAPAEAGATPMDLAALVREVFGSKVGVDVGIKRTDDAATTEVVARLSGGASSTVNRFRVSPTELKGTENFAKLSVTPGLLDALLRSSKPEFAGTLRLARAGEVQVGLAPFSVPMVGLTPQFNNAKPVRVTLTAPGTIAVEGIDALLAPESSMRSLKGAGVEGLTVEGDVTLAAFLPAKEGATPGKGPVSATLRAKVLLNAQRAADIGGTLTGDFAGGKPAGAMAVDLDITKIATAAAEKALGQDALLTSVLGDTAQVHVKGSRDAATGVLTGELTATASKLTSDGPIALRVSPQAVEVTKSAKWRFTLAPEWINRNIATPAEAGKPAKAPAFTVTSPVQVGVTIDRFALPRAEGGPKLAAALAVDIPKIDAVSGEKQPRPAVLENTTLSLTTQEGAASPTLAFRLNIASAKAGDSPAASNVGLSGIVENLVSPRGAVDPARATITASGKMPAIPTALVDVLAGQDGLLVEALGPMVALDLDAQKVPLKPSTSGAAGGATGGTLKLHASSDRATLSAEGSIDDAVLAMSKPLNVSILELTDALAGRFVKGLPAIGSIQKQKGDRPAMIVGENLRVPLSKDFSKLNGVVRIDPGEARFGTSSLFGQLLDLARIKTSGVVGQKLDPLTVTLTNGVATYPKYRLPLGEFTIESEGTVDLTTRSVDVVTWVPLGSLTDQAAGLFTGSTGLGSLLGQAPVLDAASMVPLRTRGSFDDPKTSADLELFAKSIVKQIDPGKVIEKGLDELFKKKGK